MDEPSGDCWCDPCQACSTCLAVPPAHHHAVGQAVHAEQLRRSHPRFKPPCVGELDKGLSGGQLRLVHRQYQHLGRVCVGVGRALKPAAAKWGSHFGAAHMAGRRALQAGKTCGSSCALLDRRAVPFSIHLAPQRPQPQQDPPCDPCHPWACCQSTPAAPAPTTVTPGLHETNMQ